VPCKLSVLPEIRAAQVHQRRVNRKPAPNRRPQGAGFCVPPNLTFANGELADHIEVERPFNDMLHK